jgi:hypothetical protein
MNGDTVALEGEPVATSTEIEWDGLRGIEVGLECVDRGFDLLDFVGGWGSGIVYQREGIGRGLSI